MNNGGAAFPIPQQQDSEGYPLFYAEGGMTLRDYFAAKAMEAKLISSAQPVWLLSDDDQALLAEASYKMADAMIAKREHFEGKGQ